MKVTDEMVRAFVDSLPTVYAFDAPPPSAIRDGISAALRAQGGGEIDILSPNYEAGFTDGMKFEAEHRLVGATPDAAPDAESTALYLRPYDVTMIGQAKHSGQEMVSVLAHLHPNEGWTVRFNVAHARSAGGESRE